MDWVALLLLFSFFAADLYFSWLALDPHWDPRFARPCIWRCRGRWIGDLLYQLPTYVRSPLLVMPSVLLAYHIARHYSLGIAAAIKNQTRPKVTMDIRGLRGWNSSGEFDLPWHQLTAIKIWRRGKDMERPRRFSIRLAYKPQPRRWFSTADSIFVDSLFLNVDLHRTMEFLRSMRRDLFAEIPLPTNKEFAMHIQDGSSPPD